MSMEKKPTKFDTKWHADMKAFYDGERDIMNDEKRWNDRLLNAIAKINGDEFKENLKFCLTDGCNIFGRWEITRMPVGERQDERDYGVKLWVDQYGPGISGDDYNGFMYIFLKKGKYLKVEYSC